MRPWLIAAVLLAACADAPASLPATDSTGASAPESTAETPADQDEPGRAAVTTDPDGIVPEGYELVAARVTEPGGSTCDLCLWLADNSDLRRQGLMFVTDLGAADGMAFAYPNPHTGWFWMKNTVMPLSIAFFAPDGAYLDSFDMEPCATKNCFRYTTPERFEVAVETTRGGLDELGIVPGSRLELLDLPCGTA